MNRLSFLKKLGIGAVLAIVAPKILFSKKRTYPKLTPKLVDEWIGSKPGMWIPRPKTARISEEEFRKLCIKYAHYYDMAWVKLQIKIDKARIKSLKEL